MSESLQHSLDRVRRPRVQITYDVETNGAMQQVELPFVAGIMADLSGQPKDAPPPLKDRKFVNVDKDNFDEVLEKSAPRLAYRVDNELSGDGSQLNVELNFKQLDDFDPANVASQIPALNELLQVRKQLTQLLSKLEGNDKLEQLLGDVLNNAEKAKLMAGELGIKADEATPAPESEDKQ